MALQFLLGKSGTGKTTAILNEIRENLFESPAGNPIIYIVPEQMTFLSEHKLLATPGLSGMIRSQVLSFTRLAWKVLQEVGGMNRIHLDSTGVSMLIRKIMNDKKDDLKLFARSSEKQGFLAQMEEMLTEFKRYCVKPEEIRSFLGNNDNEGALGDKLHDLEMIYQAFEDELAGKYLDSEDYFRLLGEKIPFSTFISSADVYIDGFYSLTPQELLIVEKLMKHCKSVKVALTLDKPFRQMPPDSLHLFRQTGNTYYSIYEAAQRLGVEVGDDLVMEIPLRFAEAPALIHLEENFNVRPIREYRGETAVTVTQAVNRRAEVEGTARSILNLVRDQNLRFQDIAILLRNGEAYHDIIQTIFRDYRIPHYIDAKRTMLNHPLIELIRSVLEILVTNWRYEPVFRAIKTELLFPISRSNGKIRVAVDRMENYVLSRGLKGSQWTSKDRWTYRRIRGIEFEDRIQTDREKEIENELNDLKNLLTEPIIRLSKRLKRAVDGRAFCEALYVFLEELHIPEKLEKLKLDAEDAGDLLLAREHEQAWDEVCGLLDQFVEMLGEEKLTIQKFSSVLEAGLETMKFSLVPPAIDQVIVANLDLSRLDDVKAVFVIGLTEGVLPAKLSAEGIFSDGDREFLISRGMEVAASSKTKLLDEEFTAYKAFMTASQALYLSFPLADEEGKSLLASSYIKRVKDVLPDKQECTYLNDPSDLSPEEQASFAVNHDVALSYLTAQLQLKKRNYPIHPLWWDVYNSYIKNPAVSGMAHRVLSSLFYQNRANKLKHDTSKKLYGENILASVSRMEMFNSCAFAHFAAHGLKLRERKIFRLDAPDIGDMFHAALKVIAEHLNANSIPWSSLTKEQCIHLAKAAVDTLAPKLQNQILLSTNRHHYLKRKLENVIARASLVLSEHARLSGFAPIGLELDFGLDGKLPPLSFQLKDGTKMELIGRIDRVDKAEEQDGTYLRVIDYKSSEKELNVSEVYYGLSLQMLTYLDIIITHSQALIGKEAFPAGVLYFHVHNPVVKSNGMLGLDQIEDAIFKDFKMNGLILGDPKVIQMMDATLNPNQAGSSNIIPAGFKKDGTIKSNSKIASKEEFASLNQHVRRLYNTAGNSIVDGIVDIAPYKLKDKIPCTFCSFKSVCQFDQSLEDNKFRTLTSQKKSDILELIRKEAGN
ncbi:helicase-exonuclease AddAB subunit AddB [Peribacillus saganii]|uniref:ATP-dependent helicase/deoxyribonuclease subunit B n=1 Tax=Peribacillus saganii TaxID=2303992 RepID=A0A372LCB6_9BACI|nr:helicase-exonuclease AddAB subunit AddB [Peribacillus saganii]RFU63537.1 helicase-exonuclease AddAB subunit AddB [Peribacillus saganii]